MDQAKKELKNNVMKRH